MPHAVIETYAPIIALDNKNIFFSKKAQLFIAPISVKCEDFVVRVYQKHGKIVVKLDKTTYPFITDDVKSAILGFTEYLANKLNGRIISHNLSRTYKDCAFAKNYLLDIRSINEIGINNLVKSGRIRVEIGMGKGEFLLETAKSNPEIGFIGVEIANEPLLKAAFRFTKEGLSNVRIIKHDARYVFDLFDTNSVECVYVNFPEPWFKFKKIKHSLLNADTLKKIERVLKKGGNIELLTDNLAYAVSVVTALEMHTTLRNAQNRCIDIFKGSVDTYFGRRWRKRKRTIYRVVYEKTVESAVRKRDSLVFPLRVNRDYVLENGLIFKVLDIFENNSDQRIAEVVFGKSANPQHSYFGITNTNELFLMPQSIFIADRDALKSLELATI